MIILLIFFIGFLAFMLSIISEPSINELIINKKKDIINKKKDIKDIDEINWYSVPHYKFTPSGRKINMSEYLTYKEYITFSKNHENMTRFLCHIDNMFDKQNIQNNTDYEITN